jgi:hypothetical protein
MPINFFDETYKSSTSKELFGLCDDNSTPEKERESAYLSEDTTVQESEWIAEVSNNGKYSVDFHPVDNCVKIKRPDGKDEKEFDCMLHYDSHIIFAELKERNDQKSRAWKKDAKNQLSKTIAHFKLNHTASDYNSIRAYICNRLRSLAVEPSQQMQQQFKDETGCILYIGRKIDLG